MKKSPRPSEEEIDKALKLVLPSICGYNIHRAEDGTKIGDGLGCTLAGFGACYNVSTVLQAIAIRRAAVLKQGYATYVIANLGHNYNGQEKLFLPAGWEILVQMPGAHGSYKSALIGATTFQSQEDFKAFLDTIYEPATPAKEAKAKSAFK